MIYDNSPWNEDVPDDNAWDEAEQAELTRRLEAEAEAEIGRLRNLERMTGGGTYHFPEWPALTAPDDPYARVRRLYGPAIRTVDTRPLIVLARARSLGTRGPDFHAWEAEVEDLEPLVALFPFPALPESLRREAS